MSGQHCCEPFAIVYLRNNHHVHHNFLYVYIASYFRSVWDAKKFMTYVGLDQAAVEPSSEDVCGINRSQVSSLISSLHSAPLPPDSLTMLVCSLSRFCSVSILFLLFSSAAVGQRSPRSVYCLPFSYHSFSRQNNPMYHKPHGYVSLVPSYLSSLPRVVVSLWRHSLGLLPTSAIPSFPT